jgi:hypothetical protein
MDIFDKILQGGYLGEAIFLKYLYGIGLGGNDPGRKLIQASRAGEA